MNSLLTVLADAGLASKDEVAMRDRLEKQDLDKKRSSLEAMTVEEVMNRRDFDFFGRVKWLVEYLAETGQHDEVIQAVRDHMLTGGAGQAFLRQLESHQAGRMTVPEIKAMWPRVWKP